MKRTVVNCVLSVLMLTPLAGCGGGGRDKLDLVKVSGTLYLDEKPHGPALLVLRPERSDESDKRPGVSGQVAADGSFTLNTYETGDGAPPGMYSVSIGAADQTSVDPEVMAQMMAPPRTEPAQIEIPAAGSSALEIRLKSMTGSAQEVPGALLGE